MPEIASHQIPTQIATAPVDISKTLFDKFEVVSVSVTGPDWPVKLTGATIWSVKLGASGTEKVSEIVT
jgi:hypothetical protein